MPKGAITMLRLFYPAERPLDGRCPICGHALEHIFLDELIDTALPWRLGNIQQSPRWFCRSCWKCTPSELPVPFESSAQSRSA
jgi:hypothetical protein